MEYKPKVITGKVTGTGWPLPVQYAGEVRRELEGEEMGAAGLVLPAIGQGGSAGGKAGRKHQQHPRQLRAHGFDLTPRKQTDRGGIICLPLDKNLNGDVQAKHPDWKPVECPTCGRKCWKHPEADRLAKEQDAKMLCTECAIKAGLLSPFRKEGPNRAQRRRAKRERRK